MSHEEVSRRGRMPRRGDVKAQIFSNLNHSISGLFSKVLIPRSNSEPCDSADEQEGGADQNAGTMDSSMVKR